MNWEIWLLIFCLVSCNHGSKRSQKQVDSIYKTPAEKGLANLANSKYTDQKFSEALQLYDSLISIDSAMPGYYFKRGYCKSMLFDYNGAITDYKKAINHNFSGKSNAYSNIGAVYDLCLHKYDSAIYYYNECLKLDPENIKAKMGKADAIKTLEQLP